MGGGDGHNEAAAREVVAPAVGRSRRPAGSADTTPAAESQAPWGATHMIPPQLARAARMVRPPRDFDD
jgi:hypothetical protein